MILAAGVRRGELLAWRWRDIDLETGVARVVQTLEETRALGLRFKDVKTKAGRRRVDLPASAVQVLRAHQVEQKETSLKLGRGWSANDLVFCWLPGEPWRPHNFTAQVKALAAAAGVPHFHPQCGPPRPFQSAPEGAVFTRRWRR